MMAIQSSAFAVDTHCVEMEKRFECNIFGITHTITGESTVEVVERVIGYFPLSRFHDHTKPININSLFMELTFLNATPKETNWLLPELTLLKLKGRKIESIHGASIDELIDSSQRVRWSEFDGFNYLYRHSQHRITGKFNALLSSVHYTPEDLEKQYLGDIEIWALHELFGINQIKDTNYKASILTSLLVNKEISVMEYSDLSLHLTPLSDMPLSPYSSENDDDHGGITGIEGGGDIVAAAIKKMVLLNLMKSRSVIPNYEIADHLNFDVVYRPSYILTAGGAPILFPSRFVHARSRKSSDFFPEVSRGSHVLLVDQEIRDRWHEMGLDERRSIVNEMMINIQGQIGVFR